MKAIILAAGLGKRLRPLTEKIPKCMITIANKPLIEHQINWLKHNGIKEIAINLHYLPDKITSYLGNGSKLGVNIIYSDESDKLMGTAGAVKKIEDFFENDFLVYYGDIFTNLNLDELKNFHYSNNAFVTICIRKKPKDSHPSNIIKLNKKKKIIEFLEKPSQKEFDKLNIPNIANSSIYLCRKDLLSKIPKDTYYDFAHDLFPDLVMKENIYGYILPKKYYWCEIGNLSKYKKHKPEIESIISAQN